MLRSFLFIIITSSQFYSQSVTQHLEQYLSEFYNSKNIPSVSAGVLYKGEIIWLGVKGFSDIENSLPAAPKSVYRIASISKSITAVAIMQLVERGRINLDEDVRKYIPYFPAKKWKFTARQLLNHTSGIRNYRSGEEFDNKIYFQTTREVINYIAKDTLVYQPGTRYLYTTLGYNLLAAIIESVSGLSFSDYVMKNIFAPADMKSSYPDIQKMIIPGRARGYDKNSFKEFQNAALADLSIKIPGGGFLSTAEDLLKFSDNLLKGKLINRSTLDSMLVPTKLRSGRTENYGLGFSFGVDESGRKFFGHSGSGTGFISQLLIYPDENSATAHLINLRDNNLDSPAYDLAAIVFGKQYESPKRSVADYLFDIVKNTGADSAFSAYLSIKSDTLNNLIINEEELRRFGYDLIAINSLTDAIKFFKMLVQDYPQYSKAYIGLADAYYKDGNKGLSLKNYRLALRYEPMNSYAADMIRRLGGI
jgi:serine beta-lactamase-like protein LACTB, mitochondrial